MRSTAPPTSSAISRFWPWRTPRLTRPVVAGFAVLSVAAACAPPAFAQEAAGRERAVIRQLQQQNQALTAEKDTLARERARLEAELQAARGAAADAGEITAAREAEVARREAAQAAARTGQYAEAVRKWETRYAELETLARDLKAQLAETEQTSIEAKAETAGAVGDLLACEDRNARLYALNREIIARFGERGLWERLTEAEPFTQLRKVRDWNVMQEYEDRARDLKAGQGGEATAPAESGAVP